MNSLNDIWQSILEVLSEKLTPTAMKTWFDDCTPVGLDGDSLVLHCPSEFKANIISTRYGEIIKKALSDLFSQTFDLQILVGDEINDYRAQKEEENIPPEMAGYTFDNFIVGNSNKFAHAAAVSVAKNPGASYNPLFIYGNSGLGKTHLLRAIGHYIQKNDPGKKIGYIKGDDFTVQMVKAIKDGTGEEFRSKYRNVDLFLVDDIQFIAGKEATQNEFFHTFNNLYEAGHQIVITSDRPPLEMRVLDDRLRTRFEGGLMADIQPPDLETRMAIIRNKAAQLGLILSNEAVETIAEKITSNIRQIEGVINRLTALRDITGEEISRENVDNAIGNVIRDGVYVPTPEAIIAETARYYQVTPEEIQGLSRQKNIANARHITAYLIRNLTNLSLPMIGTFLNRDHATVLSSVRKIEGSIKTDKDLSATIRDITSNINSRQR